MIRKVASQMALPALLACVVFNAYLGVSHLKRIRSSAALSLESSMIQADIAKVRQDFADMETGQRGYLVTADPAYLQPYTEAKGRLGSDFARLRSELGSRSEEERSLEAQLERVAGSKQVEMERTISLREQGYRHRAFLVVDTNEGKDYMDKARALTSSLSSMESGNFARLEEETSGNLEKALWGIIISNFSLFVLTAGLFGLIRYHNRGLERQAAESRRAFAERDAQLDRINSALSNQAASELAAIEENIRLLLEKYEGFLPREGRACAGRIKEAAGKIEELRNDLLGHPISNTYERAA